MGNNYAGDIAVTGAWEFLSADKNSLLVDVRTPTEWQATGVANLQSVEKDVFLLPWKLPPNFDVNPDFFSKLEEFGIGKDAKILLTCKSGGRSSSAAAALTAEGYKNCYNLIGGMESPEGWISSGLPIKGYK